MVGYNILSPPLFDDSDLSVLKVILKKYLWWAFTAQGILIIFYDFKTKWLLIPFC